MQRRHRPNETRCSSGRPAACPPGGPRSGRRPHPARRRHRRRRHRRGRASRGRRPRRVHDRTSRGSCDEASGVSRQWLHRTGAARWSHFRDTPPGSAVGILRSGRTFAGVEIDVDPAHGPAGATGEPSPQLAGDGHRVTSRQAANGTPESSRPGRALDRVDPLLGPSPCGRTPGNDQPEGDHLVSARQHACLRRSGHAAAEPNGVDARLMGGGDIGWGGTGVRAHASTLPGRRPPDEASQ